MIWLSLALLALLTVWGARRYRGWRDARDLRIRNARARKYCITPWIKP